MAIKHAFTSAVPDGSDTTQVRPSNWNADHNSPTFLALNIAVGGLLEWVDMPAALTELFATATNRSKVDLTYASQARLVGYVDTPGVSGAELRAQYSLDGSSWSYLDGAAGPAISLTSQGLIVSAWITITTLAKADVFLRLVGINGDALVDPTFGTLQLQVK